MQFNTDTDPLTRYREAKLAATKADAELIEATEALAKHMEAEGEKTVTRRYGDRNTRFTVTRRDTTVIDEDGLRSSLGARTFNRYTKRSVDRKALEEALETGKLNPSDVAPHLTLKQGRSYITMSESDVDEQPQ